MTPATKPMMMVQMMPMGPVPVCVDGTTDRSGSSSPNAAKTSAFPVRRASSACGAAKSGALIADETNRLTSSA
jgi:hypothetical protein